MSFFYCLNHSEKGVKEALFHLGTFYEYGKYDLARNDKKAFRNYKLANNKGHLIAREKLKSYNNINILSFSSLENSTSSSHSSDEVSPILIKQQDNDWARLKITDVMEQKLILKQPKNLESVYVNCYLEEDKSSENKLSSSSLQENTPDTFNSDVAPHSNTNNDLETAIDKISSFRILMEKGDIAATNDLALCYFSGYGVEEDVKEAVRLFYSVAIKGNSQAQYYLGVCNSHGIGCEKNLNEAEKWFHSAAVQGHPEAQFSLGSLYKWFKGRNHYYEKQSVKWFSLAAMQQHKEAQFNLGLCYEWGFGIKQEAGEAMKWFSLAAENGHVLAASHLQLLQDQNHLVIKNSSGSNLLNSSSFFSNPGSSSMLSSSSTLQAAFNL